jgi:hypothetical protein
MFRLRALLTAGLLVGAALATAHPASAAGPSIPADDFTGDGTVDDYSINWDDDLQQCQLVILPADTTGPYAHGIYVLPIQPGDSGDGCGYYLTTTGAVRSDGTWQVFAAPQDDPHGTGLVTAVRTADGFVLDRTNDAYDPSALSASDTDGDGRDDEIDVTSGNRNTTYTARIPVGLDGHFVSRLRPTVTVTEVGSGAFGDPQDLHIEVSGNGHGTPTGAVGVVVTDLFDTGPLSDQVLGLVPGNGVATADLSLPAGLPAADYGVQVNYSGDARFAPASDADAVNVAQAATVTTVGLPAPAVAGLPSVVHVHVRSATAGPGSLVPNGVAEVSVDGRPVDAEPVDDGEAVVPLPGLSAGRHSITAVYRSPEENWLDSQTTATLTVRTAATRTTVRAAPASPAVGQKVSLSVQVVSSTAAAGTPTGLVGLLIDGRPSTAKLVDGRATVTTSFARAGAHTVLVGYGGDANRAPSGSAVTVQVHR